MKADVPRQADAAFSGASSLGGFLAVLVSAGLLVSLPIRDVGYNALNLFTIIMAALAGALAVRASRRPDGAGLGWGITLLVIAVLPALVGWVGLLYLPSLLALLFAAARFTTRPH